MVWTLSCHSCGNAHAQLKDAPRETTTVASRSGIGTPYLLREGGSSNYVTWSFRDKV